MPTARAPATSVSGESPTNSASRALTAASSRPARKGSGAGLACPTSAEDTTPSTNAPRPARSSAAPSERSQLLTTTTPAPAGPERAQRGRGVGKRRELQRAEHGRAHVRARQPAHPQRPVQHGGAVVVQRPQAGLMAAAHVVLQVVGDLGGESPLGGLGAHVDAGRAFQRGPQPRSGRLEPHEGAERVEQDGLHEGQPLRTGNRRITARRRPPRNVPSEQSPMLTGQTGRTGRTGRITARRRSRNGHGCPFLGTPSGIS